MLPGSESDSVGRVVVISSSDPGGFWGDWQRLPNKGCILQALGLKENVDGRNLLEEATIVAKEDLAFPSWLGYTLDYDECLEGKEDANSDFEKAKAVTQLMASELDKHFELNFTENIVCAPVLYSGRCGGDVVAVLSMRVWT
mmetsp:Transcript_47438/g.100808  ORF Transcript_47438/g.100808 Transcript_47438/m.100808 type:complete len:142 (+) Transcript_47438:527-952(+)